MIAPKPLLLQLGTSDGTSPEIYAAEMDKELRNTYRSIKSDNKFEVDIFHSGHKYNFKTAREWFNKWL